MAAVVGAVATELVPAGWVRRPLGDPSSSTFTRAVGGGMILTAQIGRFGFSVPAALPTRLRLRVGVGYEPALGLMPLLTARPAAGIVEDPALGGLEGVVELPDEHAVPAVARQVLALIDAHAGPFGQEFPDVDALIAALTEPVPPRHRADPDLSAGAGDRAEHDDGDEGGGQPERAPTASQPLLTLLAAAGRLETLEGRLAADEPARAADPFGQLDRRFLRQLRRWLDAGAPTPPPLEDTLARLPAPPERPTVSFAQARGRYREARSVGRTVRRSVGRAARSRAGRMSVTEVMASLTAEYRRRGTDVRASAVAAQAERIHRRQQPLGRVRELVRTVRSLRSGITEIGSQFRHLSDEDPPWLQPPARAAFPAVERAPGRWVAVVLDTDSDTGELLTRALGDAVPHVGDHAQLQVWLTETPTPEITEPAVAAHLGGRRVGTLTAADAVGLADLFRGAARFDEDPVCLGTLTRSAAVGWLLEIRLPARPARPDAAAASDAPGGPAPGRGAAADRTAHEVVLLLAAALVVVALVRRHRRPRG